MKREEDQIQKAVLGHLKIRPNGDLFFFHVPNGGYRKPAEAAILYSLGVVAGVPDLIILKLGKCYALELKRKGGKLSESQKRSIPLMEAAGAIVGIADSIDSAVAWLEKNDLVKVSSYYTYKAREVGL